MMGRSENFHFILRQGVEVETLIWQYLRYYELPIPRSLYSEVRSGPELRFTDALDTLLYNSVTEYVFLN